MLKVEIRANAVTVEGYVNAVGRDSRVMQSPTGAFVEQVVPKTFERAIERAEKVGLKLNHDREIGSTADGSLKLWEDNIGLYARAVTSDAEVIKKAREKKLRGWSFAFYADKPTRTESLGDGLTRRYLEEIVLDEVSIIDDRKIPAYIGTSIEAREGGRATEYRGAEEKQIFTTTDEKPAEKRAFYIPQEIEILELEMECQECREC